MLFVLIIFFVTLVIFFRNLFKHMACMGGLCVGFRKPKKDVIPNVLNKSIWFFFVILFVPLVVSVFNKSHSETELSVLKDLNYYSYIICFVVFLLYLFSEFLFLKLIRMVDASAFFYEDNLKGNSRISPKLSFLFFMEREDDLRSTISNELIDIRNEGTMVHGSVPSYIPEEWLENNDSGHGSGKT